MKAKEYVAALWDLHQQKLGAETPEQTKELDAKFNSYLHPLYQECMEPHQNKIRQLSTEERKNDPTNRWENEYFQVMRVASEKWNAVAHGLKIKNGGEELFPFLQGGIILYELITLETDIASGKTPIDVAVGCFEFVMQMAAKLGFADSETGLRLLARTKLKLEERMDGAVAHLK